MSRKLSIIVASLGVLCARCGTVPNASVDAAAAGESALTATDLQSARDSLLAADATAVAVSSTKPLLEGFGTLFTDDALFSAWRTRILLGRDAIRAYLATVPAAESTTVSWVTARGDVSASGDAGYTFGWRTQTTTAADGTVSLVYGKFIAYWRLGVEGWKIRAYDFFQHPLEPAPPPAPEWLRQMGDAGQRGMPAVDGPADVAELFAADLAFSDLSAASGTEVAFGTYAAEYAVTLPNIAPMNYGRQAIAEANQQPDGAEPLTWTPRAGDIASSNDLGFTMGYYFYGGRWGKYTTVWERQPDHQWRFILDTGSSVAGSVPPTGL